MLVVWPSSLGFPGRGALGGLCITAAPETKPSSKQHQSPESRAFGCFYKLGVLLWVSSQ